MKLKQSVHTHSLRVPFSDVDMAGIVYAARYADYILKAWESYFRDLGIPWESYVGKSKTGLRGLPVIKMNLEFKAPARCGDWITINTFVSRLTDRRIYFRFDIVNDQTARLLLKASLCVTAFGADYRPMPIPAFIKQAIESNRS